MRKYIPPALFLASLTSLMISLARPALVRTVSVRMTTVILAIDVSDSMLFEDVKPNRLKAAEDAALSFIQKQQGRVQIGIVEFADDAQYAKDTLTFSDALALVRRQIWQSRHFSISNPQGDIAKISLEELQPWLDALCYTP